MVYIVLAVAIIAVVSTVLSAYGKVPRNRLIGVRTRATLASDEAWRIGHRAALVPMIVTGGLAFTGGVVGATLGFVNEPFVVIVLALVLLAGAVWSLAAARQATS